MGRSRLLRVTGGMLSAHVLQPRCWSFSGSMSSKSPGVLPAVPAAAAAAARLSPATARMAQQPSIRHIPCLRGAQAFKMSPAICYGLSPPTTRSMWFCAAARSVAVRIAATLECGPAHLSLGLSIVPVLGQTTNTFGSLMYTSTANSSSTLGSRSTCLFWGARRGIRTSRPDLAAAAGKKGRRDSLIMSDENQEYWRGLMERIEMPILKKLLENLEPEHPVGIRNPRGRRKAEGKQSTGVPCYDYYVARKKEYPRHMILVKIGEFYETCGFDALLLCQFANVNPMAPKSGVARAGVPINNMPRTVRSLNAANLSVVVCGEVKDPAAKARATKERFIIGISTPAHPCIFTSALEEGGHSDEYYAESLPLIGIASSKAGYTFCEYKHEINSIFVSGNLSVEALMSRLQASRAAPPLLLHQSLKEITPGDASLGQIDHMVKEYTRQAIHTRNYGGDSASDPVKGFEMEVRAEMDLGPGPNDPVIRIFYTNDAQRGRPRPPYLSTVNNLGLNDTPGMPNILDAVLPEGTPPESKRWVQSLLRHPPPPEIALQLHQACSHLACTFTWWGELGWLSLLIPLLLTPCPAASWPPPTASLPDLYAGMSMKKVSEVLQSRQSHEAFFRELAGLLVPVQELLERPDLAPIAEGVLSSVRYDLQIDKFDLSKIAAGVDQALLEIGKVVDIAGMPESSVSSSSSDEDMEEEMEDVNPSRAPPADRDGGRANAMQRMIDKGERFRDRLLPGVIKEEEQKVEQIRARVFTELDRVLEPVLKASMAGRDLAKNRPFVKYVDEEPALWISANKHSAAVQVGVLISGKISDRQISGKLSKAAEEFDRLGLRPPTNRKNQTELSYRSTKKLDDLMAEYHQANEAALEKVEEHLRKLCKTLEPVLTELVLAAQMSIVARALMEHVDEARRRDWCVPELEPEPPSAQSGRPRMEVTGFWPFWKELRAPDTVCNDLVLDRIVLLTGSNMAGKSTVLRSVAAVALLGCCGLLVPAARAAIPFYDAFMLRNFSGDSPLEGLSSYGLECVDIRAVLRDATARSLVLLDEMGKGTEVLAATAMSGALLQELAGRGSSAVFATHLHDLVAVTRPLEQQQQLRFMCMEVKEAQGHGVGSALARRDPTWRIIDGVCFESLALQVALKVGVSEEFVNTAAQLYAQLRARNRPHAELPALAGGRVASTHDSEEAAASAFTSSEVEEVEEAGNSGTEGATGEAGSSDAVPDVPDVPAKALEDAITVLRETVATAEYQERSQQDAAGAVPASGCDGGLVAEAAAAAAEVRVHRIGPKQQPPAMHCNKAAVYVIKYSSGWFYCGETDNIKGRLKYHRTAVANSKHKGPGLEIAYTLFDDGGKSRSRLVESRCITALQQQGFHLTSARDARNRNFGRAAPGSEAGADVQAA